MISCYVKMWGLFSLALLLIICSTNVTGLGLQETDEFQEAIKTGKVKKSQDFSKVKPIKVPAKVSSEQKLDIFCNNGYQQKHLRHLWTTITMRLLIHGDEYSIYRGPNASDVYQQYMARSWVPGLMWRADTLSLSVFNKTCVAIWTDKEYSVNLVTKMIDPWLVACLVMGFILFVTARPLSKNILFYYGTGISLGLIASLLVLVFIMSRFMPQKFGAYAVLLGGWSISVFLLQYVWEHIQVILEDYVYYVFGYFAVAVIVSFCILYYKGPVTNPRAINLIKWSIQVIGLTMMLSSTQIPEVSVTLIICTLTWHNFPSFVTTKFRQTWRKRFPPKRRLLTEDEYLEEGQKETQQALDDLREYCRSPNCDAWKTISRLNSPQRFASFIEGTSHLSEEECMDFDDNPMPRLPKDSDEESEISFTLNSL